MHVRSAPQSILRGIVIPRISKYFTHGLLWMRAQSTSPRKKELSSSVTSCSTSSVERCLFGQTARKWPTLLHFIHFLFLVDKSCFCVPVRSCDICRLRVAVDSSFCEKSFFCVGLSSRSPVKRKLTALASGFSLAPSFGRSRRLFQETGFLPAVVSQKLFYPRSLRRADRGAALPSDLCSRKARLLRAGL